MIRIPLPRANDGGRTDPYLALTTKAGDPNVWLELHNGEEAVEAAIDLATLDKIIDRFGAVLAETQSEIEAFKRRVARHYARRVAP